MVDMVIQNLNVASGSFEVDPGRSLAAGCTGEVPDLEPLNDDVAESTLQAEQAGLAAGDEPGAVHDGALAGIVRERDISRSRIAGGFHGDDFVVYAALDLDSISRMHGVSRVLYGAPGSAQRARVRIVPARR